MLKSGEIILENFISHSELDKAVEIMSRLPTGTYQYGSSKDYFNKSIGIGHVLYNWFNKKIFKKIQKYFSDDCKMLFCSYVDELTPLDVHSDYYHKRIGEPYMAILIPVSVDNNKDKLSLSKTIIFNQIDTYIDDRDHKKREFKINKKTYNKNIANNSLSLYEDELSHCDKDILKALSVKQILPWTKENAIYWDEKLLHCSNNFKTKGIKSKQHIIIHTYTENENELV